MKDALVSAGTAALLWLSSAAGWLGRDRLEFRLAIASYELNKRHTQGWRDAQEAERHARLRGAKGLPD